MILVPTTATALAHTLGLPHNRLLGAHATAVIRADALLDTEVEPRDWQATQAADSHAA